MQHFFAHGKLLLSAEYFVLDGATALALPTIPGQSLEVQQSDIGEPHLHWRSYDSDGSLWFEATYSLYELVEIDSNLPPVADQLQRILMAARLQNPAFLTTKQRTEVVMQLGFPRAWGLGTSSTLIHTIAQWAAIDPFRLLFDTMGGSAYDIACAGAKGPILYQLQNGQPTFEHCAFHPSFKTQLYFVYLGNKQNSREGIRLYKGQLDRKRYMHEITGITYEMLRADTLSNFQSLMRQHENLVAETIGLAPVQQTFPDFPGAIKSLGAWGGDFILAASDESEKVVLDYFKSHDLDTCLFYTELIKEST